MKNTTKENIGAFLFLVMPTLVMFGYAFFTGHFDNVEMSTVLWNLSTIVPFIGSFVAFHFLHKNYEKKRKEKTEMLEMMLRATTDEADKLKLTEMLMEMQYEDKHGKRPWYLWLCVIVGVVAFLAHTLMT